MLVLEKGMTKRERLVGASVSWVRNKMLDH